ncbi:MAG: O-antigen ligase family protein [Ilumatobacteraceae bacterium]|nr:O-antigen ligase family protein [Ilumatobacteraceae bacterium]
MAIVVGVAPLGLVLLARRALAGDVASRVLAGALAWTVLSGLVSGAPRSALLGFAGRDLSALTVVGASGFWMIGRNMSHRGRSLLVEVLVWSTSACALVGILQVVADVQQGPLRLLAGRPTGFVTNPVYFGALASAGLVAATLCWGPSWRRMTLPVVVLGIATSLSGSRVALMAAILTLLAQAVFIRRREIWMACGLAFAAIAGGVLLDRTVGAGRNAASRLGETAEIASGDGRFTVWRYGFEAWLDRPILGHGFGRFRPAVQGKFSPSFVRDHAADEVVQPWFDPHNVGVGVLVATGIIGVVLFLTWAFIWGRSVGGPLVWLLVPIALHWLLQPVSLFTLPLAMLVFAAAGAPEVVSRDALALDRWLKSAIAVGLVLGLSLLLVDASFQRALQREDAGGLDAIASLVGDDPILADVVAQAYSFDGDLEAEIEWRERAASTEPDRPFWWSRLADVQRRADLFDEAESSLDRAFELQPYNQRTQLVEILLALHAEDEKRLDAALAVACELGQSDCTLDAATLIEQRQDAEAESSASP